MSIIYNVLCFCSVLVSSRVSSIRQTVSMRSSIIFTHVISVIFIISYLSGSCNGGEDIEVAPMEKTEQEAMYSAIQGFVGKEWNGSDLYPDPCGWTPIQGVSCDLYDGFWYVTALNIGPIHDNSLDCSPNVEFRPQLFELRHLKALSFFNCFISPHHHPVAIPSENWEKLAGSLESLEFRSNTGLIGEIPASFGGFMKLQSLVLLENGLKGELPTNIGNLISLRRLVLAGNSFTGRIPDSFGSLNELLILDMSRNALHGTLPLTIGGLASLIKLDLSNNLLEGTLPTEIGHLKNLTLLDLRNNKLSGGLTNSLQEMGSLEELVLSNNPIGGDLKGLEWKNMKNLANLDLSSIGLTGNIPDSISELKRLRFLGLNNNNLTGNLSPKIAALPCISALYLNGNNLTGELKFSGWFYEKMRRRFGAWDNPNLCFPIELMPTSHVPLGVKPCQQQVPLSGLNTRSKLGNEHSHFMATLEFSNHGFDRFSRSFLVEMMMMGLLFNFLL